MALDLNDKTANGNTLTNNGATEETSSLPFVQSTSAASITTGNYLSAANAASLRPSQFTIEAWIKTTNFGGVIFQSYSQNSNVAGILVHIQGAGKVRFAIGRNTGLTSGVDWTDLVSATVVATGSWVHVACTYDGSNMRIYIGGSSTPDASLSWSNNPGYAASNYVMIGIINTNGTPSGFEFNGLIDEVRLWNVARTGAEIAANYNKELAGNESGLAAYWPFEAALGSAFAAQGVWFT